MQDSSSIFLTRQTKLDIPYVLFTHKMKTENLKDVYNPEGSSLRTLQLRMLEILKSVDAVCKKHNIPYWLSSGTLLGAVRHEGFIPWDDDIDIELLRDDYQKLLKILPQELPEEYVLQTTETDSGYVYLYAKVRDTNSYIEEKCVFNKHFQYNGAFIDIFPLEPTNKRLAKIASVCYNRMCLGIVGKNKVNPTFRFSYTLLTQLIFPLFRFISPSYRKGIVHHTYGVGFLNYERRIEEVFPLSKVAFEGYEFNAPNNCDAYLKRLYGDDYMKIPDNIEYHIAETNIKIW